MRILRFLDDAGLCHWGQEIGHGIASVLMGDLFAARKFSEKHVRVVRRLPPVDPPNIIAIGRNYVEHAKEMHSESLEAEPLIFLKASTSIIGPEDPIVLPKSAPNEVDYEAELAVVIGMRAKDVTPEDALRHVFGFTCANDVSARDCQKRRDKQWARGKSFDTFCPIGPVIVTTDELDPAALNISARLNGQIVQDSNTSKMIFSVPQLVSYLSHQFTLLPGTLILTGTPAGVGAGRTPPVFLRAGDEVSVEIEGIGSITNLVRDS